MKLVVPSSGSMIHWKSASRSDFAAKTPDYIASDCALAGHHIAQGMEVNQLPAARLLHPLGIMRLAYGLE